MTKDEVSLLKNEIETLELKIKLLAPKIKDLRSYFRHNPDILISGTSEEIISSWGYITEISQLRMSLECLEEILYEEDYE